MTGGIPKEIGKLKKLSRINISQTGIGGEIPAELGQCDALLQFMAFKTNLWLNGNKLSGVVPAEVQAHPKWQATTGWKYETNILPQQEGYGLTLE